MLTFLCLSTGAVLAGLAFMQYRDGNRLAPLSGVLGVVLLLLGVSGDPSRVFVPSIEKEFPRPRAIQFLGFTFWKDIPPDKNAAGEPAWWANFGEALSTKDFADIWYHQNKIPAIYHSRGEPSLRSCEKEKREVGEYVVCVENGLLHVLATDEIRAHIAQTRYCLKDRCAWARGRLFGFNIEDGAAYTDWPIGRPGECAGFRNHHGATIEIQGMDNRWYNYEEQGIAPGHYVRAKAVRVINEEELPALISQEWNRISYLHLNKNKLTWVCF